MTDRLTEFVAELREDAQRCADRDKADGQATLFGVVCTLHAAAEMLETIIGQMQGQWDDCGCPCCWYMSEQVMKCEVEGIAAKAMGKNSP